MKNTISLLGLLTMSLFFACKSDTTQVASAKASADKTMAASSETIKPAMSKVTTTGQVEVKEIVAAKASTKEMPSKEMMKDKMKEMTEKVTAEPAKAMDKVVETIDSKVKATTTEVKETMNKTADGMSDKVSKVMPKAEAPAASNDTKIVAPPTKEPVVQAVEKAPAKKAMAMHDVFDGLLKKYVSNSGKVNYAGIKGDVAVLDGYLKTLSSTSLTGKSKKEKLAFWINAYNAYTIKKIVNNYPLNSITDLDGGKPWDTKWINIDGQKLSLNNIENDIIRPKYNEPRIHFAVNCAAKSCPPLLNKAWTADNLESNFQKQTKAFVNSSLNTISADKLTLSKIFEWYGEDFGDLEGFIRKYSSTTINKGATIGFKDYDWSLNN